MSATTIMSKRQTSSCPLAPQSLDVCSVPSQAVVTYFQHSALSPVHWKRSISDQGWDRYLSIGISIDYLEGRLTACLFNKTIVVASPQGLEPPFSSGLWIPVESMPSNLMGKWFCSCRSFCCCGKIPDQKQQRKKRFIQFKFLPNLSTLSSSTFVPFLPRGLLPPTLTVLAFWL